MTSSRHRQTCVLSDQVRCRVNNGFVPDPSGTSLGFLMAGGSLPTYTRKWVGFWAKVTNNTHYDLSLGDIQTLDHLFVSIIYTSGASDSAEGSNLLDIMSSNTSYWYDTPVKIAKKTSSQIPLGGTGSTDSPFNGASYIDTTKGDGYLIAISMDNQAQTHLAVGGGFIPGGGPGVNGFPIGLSSAAWHLSGQAVNTANQTNPGAADKFSTLNLQNWSFQMGSGAGPTPPSLAGAANGPWTSNGDGVIKYLSLSNSSVNVMAPYNNSAVGSGGAGASSIMPDAPHGPTMEEPSASIRLANVMPVRGSISNDHWDHALDLVEPVLSIIPVPQTFDNRSDAIKKIIKFEFV